MYRFARRAPDDARFETVETLLERNGLPTDDLRESDARFHVAFGTDDESVGAAGFERYGSVGLLRSVAVAEPAREAGLGSELCDRVEADARESDVERLYLLTGSAADFFATRGYERIAREEVPARLREHPQFTDLCSDSATAMYTRL